MNSDISWKLQIYISVPLIALTVEIDILPMDIHLLPNSWFHLIFL